MMRNAAAFWHGAGLIAISASWVLAAPKAVAPRDAADSWAGPHSPTGSGSQPASAWVLLKDPRGAFQVLMPGKPESIDRLVPLHGKEILTHFFRYDGERVGYLFTYADLPPTGSHTYQVAMGDPHFRDGFLDGMLHGLAKTRSAGADQKVTFVGQPGRQVHLTAPNGDDALVRYGFAGNRLYLGTVFERGAKAPAADTTRFFNSARVNRAHIPQDVLKPRVAQGATESGPESFAAGSDLGAPATMKRWAWFHPPGGGFAVRAPGQPEHHALRVSTASGLLQYQQYLTREDASTFETGYVEYGTGDQDGEVALAAARDRFVRASRGRITDTEDITVSGKQGVQFRVEMPGRQVAMVRLFLSDGKLYQVGVITPYEESYSDASMAFLNSFRLQ